MKGRFYLSMGAGLSLCLCLLVACKEADRSTAGADRLVASVYNRSLYLKELDGLFPENASPKDSQQIIMAYTDRWVRASLLMYEAERNIPKDLNIDELVQKYRESLILNSYEEQLVKTGLDTTISDVELGAFYENNKSQYQLETPIIRCYLLKLPKSVPQADSLQKWWNNPKSGDNLKKMQTFAQQKAKNYILNDSLWSRVDDIAALLPKGTLSVENVSSNKEVTVTDDEFKYYFKVLGLMNKQEIAPLSFIREQASKYILHQRKTQLLEKKKQEMYDLGIQKNNVKIYSY